MLWLERKYISLLSFRLDRFKQKTSSLYNFRCPFCGDSKKNKNKTRGYLISKNGHFYFYCQNCSKPLSFDKFLESIDQNLYEQFLYEGLQNEQESNPKKPLYHPAPKQKPVESPFQGLSAISDLLSDHWAREYLTNRKIPSKYFKDLYCVREFKAFVNSLVPGKFENIRNDTPRIVIPLQTRNSIVGFQGRSLEKDDKPKYITIILDDDLPKLYGLDRADLNKRYYITEGPFDSLFLENGMAVCGSDIISVLHKIHADKELAVAVYDNEPRNAEIVKKMRKTIKEDWKLCIWPAHFEFKDINDAVLGGLNPAEIMHIIDEHTFNGLEAELEMVQWRK